ncbi:MAG: hypothetical protein L0Z50_01260 [Verrucomicrobiales bacterium]|nr:hypothetical protein [Verrucomicrobiales bacterium]
MNVRSFFIVLALVAFPSSSCLSYESIPAKWRHDLASTALVGYKNAEHLVVSSIYTGTLGSDAIVQYSLEVKVSSWGRPFSSTLTSKDGKAKETLTVSLYESSNSKEMRADFEHLVSENGSVILKFCGTTVLARVS